MIDKAKSEYVCPICLGIAGTENDDTLIRQQDIVYKDELAMVFVASYFIGKNEGHLIVVPTTHYENIFDLPDKVGVHIFSLAKKFSAVMQGAYRCGGVTTLQNNGVNAGQHALHYHLHLFPRYKDDNIYAHMNSKRQTTPAERVVFAKKLVSYV